jgi:hypothetical protein
MHALLVHFYHLALHMVDFVMRPVWRPFVACLGIAVAARATGAVRTAQGVALAAGGAILVGWLLQDIAWLATWPPPPIARLPGLALIVLADATLRARSKGRGWGLLLASSALAAWWLRGAPLSGAGIVNCMPVFLGLAFAFPLARRLARGDAGWGSVAAALALAAALHLTGASPHWARAALMTALAALALIGLPQAWGVLAGMITVASAAALVASDRGRLVPVDVACVVPLLAWPVTEKVRKVFFFKKKKQKTLGALSRTRRKRTQ